MRLQFWKSPGPVKQWPTLAFLACRVSFFLIRTRNNGTKIFKAPSSSASIERTFSQVGKMQTPARSSTLAENYETIMICKKSSKLFFEECQKQAKLVEVKTSITTEVQEKRFN